MLLARGLLEQLQVVRAWHRSEKKWVALKLIPLQLKASVPRIEQAGCRATGHLPRFPLSVFFLEIPLRPWDSGTGIGGEYGNCLL